MTGTLDFAEAMRLWIDLQEIAFGRTGRRSALRSPGRWVGREANSAAEKS